MKNCSKLLFILIFSIFSLPLFAKEDPYEEVFFLAKKLEASGAYNEAFIEYKRYIFLQDYCEGNHQEETYTALSRLYEQESKLTKAVEAIQMAQAYNNDESLKLKEVELLRSLSTEKKNDISANTSLLIYRFNEEISPALAQAAWIAILENNIVLEKWDDFEATYSTVQELFADLFTEHEQTQLNAALEKIHKFKPKKPMVALYLSLIPGLGQLYAHNPKDALNAFLLNGALIGVSVYSLINLNIIDFAMFEFDPLLRFYRGNLYNAQKEVYEYNDEKMTALKEPVLQILSSK